MKIVRLAGCAVLISLTACSKKQETATETPSGNELKLATTNAAAVAAGNTNQEAAGTNAVAVVEPAQTNAVPQKTAHPAEELYQEGRLGIRNAKTKEMLEAAVRKVREAAEQGHPKAEHALGVCFYGGIGVAKSHEEAAEWFRKSAAQGDRNAQFKLASIYIRGDGVPQDDAKGVELLRKAADQGHVEAQYNLATLYATGKNGVAQEPAEAAKWFQKAAEGGHATAQSNLGVLYAAGEVLEKNPEEAVRWWRKAAEQGQPSAQFNLAQALVEGKATEKDLVEAYKWYSLAAEQGDRDAAQMRNAVAVELTPGQLGDALTRAREFKSGLRAKFEEEERM